jgi:hypothetical protein
MLLLEEELRFRAIPTPSRQDLIDEGYITADLETTLDKRIKKDSTVAELIDEIPNELHQTLLSEDEQRPQAIPTPSRQDLTDQGYITVDPKKTSGNRIKKDPTAAEWARLRGYNTDYELPIPNIDASEENQPRHVDKVIQTLMFPEELETRLRDLRNKAETAIEETGANICYAAIGFLEWFESQNSDKARLAPLLLVPVRIAKGRLDTASGTYCYTITFTGEDILPNLSLREKLRTDFGLAIPDLDDSSVPEEYFLDVERLIAGPNQQDRRWKIRRHATIALFNFSKQLMYQDLDPAHWPKERSILNHAIVNRFFVTNNETVSGGGNSFSNEYAIDDLAKVHEHYPVIDDADSSQHSALIDAIQGKNLVIEGPPGTGKSQTITNIFAAALAQGKKVLFVAEKLAALEVVKRRLDHAGLGDFCLELHSHKTQKRKVLDDIATRLRNQDTYRNPEQIGADIVRYEELKNELRSHANLINSHWKNTGKTIHEILMAASRYRESLGIDAINLHPEGYDGHTFNCDIQRLSRDTICKFADVYKLIAIQLGENDNLRSHPWHGVGNRNLQIFDNERVRAVLSRWQDSLETLNKTMVAAYFQLRAKDTDIQVGEQNGGALHEEKFDEIEGFKNALKIIPSLHGDEILAALHYLHGDNLVVFNRHLKLLRNVRDCHRELAVKLNPQFLDDQEAHSQLRAACTALRQLGAAGQGDLSTVAKYLKRIERLQDRLHELGQPMSDVAIGLGHTYMDVIKPNEIGISEFRALIELVGQLRPALLKLRGECFDDDILDDLLPTLTVRLEALRSSHADLSHYFAVDQLPPKEVIDKLRTHLDNAGLFRWFNADWRASRRLLLQITSKPEMRLKDLLKRLEKLQLYIKDKQSLENDTRYKSALGTNFCGLDTAIIDLSELRAWYKLVRMRYGIGFGPKVALGDVLLAMSSALARGIQSLRQQGIHEQIDAVLRELGELKAAFDEYSPIQPKDAALLTTDGPLSTLAEQIRRDLGICQQQMADSAASLSDVERTVQQLGENQSSLQALSESTLEPQWLNGQIDLLVNPNQLDEATLAVAVRTAEFASALDEKVRLPILRDGIRQHPNCEFFAELQQLAVQMESAWQTHLYLL